MRRIAARRAGFTLLELMLVMALLGAMTLLLPPRLDTLGDRARLESAASTLVSVFTGARETAIADGHETRVQFDLPGTSKDRRRTGRFRYLVTSLLRKKSAALQQDGAGVEERRDEVADEWIETEWRPLPDGVVLTGFSTQAGQWIRSNPRGDPVEISFEADGTVRPACALRLESVDMPTGADRTLTVLVNALTSTAELLEGEADLPKSREPSDFK